MASVTINLLVVMAFLTTITAACGAWLAFRIRARRPVPPMVPPGAALMHRLTRGDPMSGWQAGGPDGPGLRLPDYGLLVSVASTPSALQAALLRGRLAEAGVRATIAPAGRFGVQHVLVFPQDEARARTALLV